MNDMPARVPSEEFELALSHALAVPPNFEPAPARVVAGFLASAEHAVLSWIAYRIGSRGAPSALAIGLLLRGRTVLILPAGRPTTRFDAAATTAVFGALLSDLDQQPYTYAQCILRDGCEPLARVVQSAGFARLTGLRYLERDARYPWIEPPPGELAWLTYTPQRHSEFCAAVAATYVDTHDCPELVGCRTMDDVLAAHRSAGPFEPALWALLLYNDRPAGVLLCTNHGRTFEIVYVGVIAEFRRRGLSEMLLRRAIADARARHATRILVAVDERNAPALRSYAKLDFEEIAQREVFLRLHPS